MLAKHQVTINEWLGCLMAGEIGAKHDFHDPEYARDWAERFLPTPPRQQLFDVIIEGLLEHPLPRPHILELGIGPGYLALEVLRRVPTVTYEGLDFSQPMLAIAAERLREFRSRLTLTQADLTNDAWNAKVSQQPGAIVSTWALHDLGSEAAIHTVYNTAKKALPARGLLLNGDFIKPSATKFEYEPGRLTIDRHLTLLSETGFHDVQCLAYLEAETAAPTSANNYACFVAYT